MSSRLSKLLASCTVTACLFGSLEPSQAGYFFDVTNVTINPGMGIADETATGRGVGTENGVLGGIRLGVDNTLNSAPGGFNADLNVPYAFSAGDFQFNSAETSITLLERAVAFGRLDYDVGLTFTDPDGVSQTVDLVLFGSAFFGPVNDGAVDFILDAQQTYGVFGSWGSGSYMIGIDSLALSSLSDIQHLNVSFTVTTAPVPEPTSLALLGLGAVGVAVRYRRKRLFCTPG